MVNLPRRAALAQQNLPDGIPNTRSVLAPLADLSLITKINVSATQMEWLDYGEVLRDFRKLSAILEAAQAQHPDPPLLAAYVGVFANAARPRFNFDLLASRIRATDVRPDVKLLKF